MRPTIEAVEVLERAGYTVIRGGKYGNRELKIIRPDGNYIAKLPVRAGCVDRGDVARLVLNSERK